MTEALVAVGSMASGVRIYFTFIDREESALGTVEVNLGGSEGFTVPSKKEQVHLRFQGRQYTGRVDRLINDISVDASGKVMQQLLISCKKIQVR